MADEESKNQHTDPEADAPEAPVEEPTGDASQAPEAEERAPEAEEQPAAEEPAEEAPAEEPAAEEAEGEAPAAEEGDAGGDEELEGMDWKARARLERSRQSGAPGPQRSPEERAAERTERRRATSRRRRAYRPRGRQRRKGTGRGTPPADRDSVAPKTRQGTVVSNKADKTITVRIDIVRRHPAYEKIVRRSSKLQAHDERNEANEGDVVRVIETRPLSRTKRWRLAEILEKAK